MEYELNDIIDMIVASLTLVAVLISAIAVFLSAKSLNVQINSNKYIALITQAQRNEELLSTDLKLFEIYSISQDELISDDVTAKELVYILSDLRQGEIYNRIGGGESITPYRANFLKSSKTRLIIRKYIYNKLMSESLYLKDIMQYISQVDDDESVTSI